MKYIAIIGYGVVGGGITAVIEANREAIKRTVGDEVDVKYILDLRNFPDSPYADRVVHDITPILEDRSVELVCETMGGSHPAFEFSVQCMEAGKSVVTSNKEVVANYGEQLLECARANGVSYMFEASVGGGIPLIRSFLTSVACDKVTRICGIVNGTTNYILTKMKEDGRDFDEVLKEAQLLGYAERDPSADIDGIDAKRKIIILTALASGIIADDADVTAVSMRNITQDDIKAAEMLDGEIKLVACANIDDDNVSAFVSPMIVNHNNPISRVSGVYNAISVTSETTGDIMYYGRGAGRLPTAGAVVADVCAVLSGASKTEFVPSWERRSGFVKPFSDIAFTYYIKADCGAEELRDKLESLCDGVRIISDGTSDGGACAEAIAGKLTERELNIAIPNAKYIRILG